MTQRLQYTVLWLFFSLLTMAIAMLYLSASYVDGQYIPVGNDSFYHARRIIDAAIGSRGFYQFDPWIHVPDGSWLNWPWAYDYLLALALRLALWVRPDTQPMAFLAYVPVAWALVNTGLLTLIMRQVRLPLPLAAIGLLAFSLLPLTQNLHGVGLIDHHFIELTFVLLTVLAGLRLFQRQQRADAIVLGLVLGFAPAFHNGLFILQIPVLASVFLLWLRGMYLPRSCLQWVAGALVAGTVLILLPSEPVYDGQFEFWTLSWFHLYVAVGSGIACLFFAARPQNLVNTGLLLAIAAALLIPLFARLATGAAFVSGELDIIGNITEAQSPLRQLAKPGGLHWLTSLYGWLLLAIPPLVIVLVRQAAKEREPADVFFAVIAIFGLLLMLAQYRLHPFGSWALIAAGLLAVERLRRQHDASLLVTSAVTLALLALALQPPLRHQLFERVPPGLDRDYAASRSLYPALSAACQQNPGTVLSLADDGHPIRYHTECNVLVNNFLMTPLHARKLREMSAVLGLSAQQLVDRTDFRYVFVRLDDVFYSSSTGVLPTPVDVLREQAPPLFFELAFARELPSGYRLLGEVRVQDERDFAFARVFEIVRDDGTP